MAHTQRSDIDLAVAGGHFDNFYWGIKENVHSLLLFDLVNLDTVITQDLAKELQKDDITIYEKLTNFTNYLHILQKANFALANDDEIYRTGIIGQFNLTFELAWKALQD